MAKPVYTICCQAVSHDSETKLMSYFHVLEGLDMQVAKIPKPVGTKGAYGPIVPDGPTVPLHVYSVWVREEGDTPDRVYEWQFVMRRLNGQVHEGEIGEFSFEKIFYRIQATISLLITPEPRSGILELTTRIRPRGEEEWMSQTFPLPMNITVMEGQEATPDADQPSEPTKAE